MVGTRHYVLIAISGSKGDVLPLLSLGAELVSRGSRVLLACPDGMVEEAARHLGLDFECLTSREDYESSLREKFLLATRYEGLFLQRYFVPWNLRVERLIRRVRSPSVLVVGVDRPSLWGDLAVCRAHRLPLVRLRADLPAIVGSPCANSIPTGRIQAHIQARVEAEWRSAARASGDTVGFNQIARLWQSVRRSVPIIALWPPWAIGLSAANPHQHMVGFLPAPALPSTRVIEPARRCGSDRPLIVFCAGTVGTTQFWHKQFFEISAKICSRLRYRGLFVGSSTTCETDAFIEQEEYIPLRDVLPVAKAIVHHGGIGTAAAAIECGVPQMLVPRVFGQPSNAEWMRKLGVGIVVNPKCYDIDQAARGLRTLLEDPRFGDRARELSQLCRPQLALKTLCEMLESLTVD